MKVNASDVTEVFHSRMSTKPLVEGLCQLVRVPSLDVLLTVVQKAFGIHGEYIGVEEQTPVSAANDRSFLRALFKGPNRVCMSF